jgi:membrane protease YdiL (CAAX protease family)
MTRALLYLLGIIIAEIAAVVLPTINPDFIIVGLALYAALLLVIIADAARMDRFYDGKFVLSLALVPLIRIFSLILPLTQVPQMWWYPVIYLPLLAAALAMAYVAGYTRSDIGLTLRSWPLQLFAILPGIGLGFVEYSILSPQPLISGLTWSNALLPALLLFISTGVVEELIFRGVMQKSAVDMFGNSGIVFVSLIFAILHVGWAVGPNATMLAWLDILFVFGMALLFGWFVKKTGSLLGVILCHGAINVVLFIVAPLLFMK